MVYVVQKKFALTFCIWRDALHPEGKCPDTTPPDDICLDTLRPEETRCIQKVNALTLLIWKVDTMARIVRKTFGLTFCICKTYAGF